MKYLDEYRNPELAHAVLERIRASVTRPWVIMEVCGGQTHAIVRSGIDQLLPSPIELVHGPGCPVCVTPIGMIDAALEIARDPRVIFTSYGDMLRVPGSTTDLLTIKAEGGDVRIVASPLDALALARACPNRQVVFFAVGFETTAPASALAILQAHRETLTNFSMLVAHVLIPPTMSALLESPDNRVQAYLAAGHVCTVAGVAEYERISRHHRIPVVITGFEPLDLLVGILSAVEQLESGNWRVDNQYARAVHPQGNTHAQEAVARVFKVAAREWRGIGTIPASGLTLRPEFARYDASMLFDVWPVTDARPTACISGDILRGVAKPVECPAFGTECTPSTPLGATMVSSEGACAAYFKYHRSPQHASGGGQQ